MKHHISINLRPPRRARSGRASSVSVRKGIYMAATKRPRSQTAPETKRRRRLIDKAERLAPKGAPPSTCRAVARELDQAIFTGQYAHATELALLVYNLESDCARIQRHALSMCDEPYTFAALGDRRRALPRRALRAVAEVIGYRYQRALPALAAALPAEVRGEFDPLTLAYLSRFDAEADAAHEANERGEDVPAARAVVVGFADELRRMAGWIDRAGLPGDAERLRRAVAEQAPPPCPPQPLPSPSRPARQLRPPRPRPAARLPEWYKHPPLPSELVAPGLPARCAKGAAFGQGVAADVEVPPRGVGAPLDGSRR